MTQMKELGWFVGVSLWLLLCRDNREGIRMSGWAWHGRLLHSVIELEWFVRVLLRLLLCRDNRKGIQMSGWARHGRLLHSVIELGWFVRVLLRLLLCRDNRDQHDNDNIGILKINNTSISIKEILQTNTLKSKGKEGCCPRICPPSSLVADLNPVVIDNIFGEVVRIKFNEDVENYDFFASKNSKCRASQWSLIWQFSMIMLVVSIDMVPEVLVVGVAASVAPAPQLNAR